MQERYVREAQWKENISLALDLISSFEERGDQHLKQGGINRHVQIRQDQSRPNKELDSLEGVSHIRLKSLKRSRV